MGMVSVEGVSVRNFLLTAGQLAEEQKSLPARYLEQRSNIATIGFIDVTVCVRGQPAGHRVHSPG